MDAQRDFILKQLNQCNNIGLDRIYFATNMSIPNNKDIQCFLEPRIIVPLTGEKKISFMHDEHDFKHSLVPGEVVFVRTQTWTLPEWTSCHEMLSAVFFKDYIRLLYINFDHEKQVGVPPKPDCIYNVKYPQDNILSSILYIVKKSAEIRARNEELMKLYIKSLMLYLADSVNKIPSNISISKSFVLWNKISQYVNENYLNTLSRSAVAREFGIQSGYLSTICKRYSGKGFKEYINNLKLEHSCNLLINTNYTLDEICNVCGYNYTSYYSRIFKNTYGVTPNQYRIVALSEKYNPGRSGNIKDV